MDWNIPEWEDTAEPWDEQDIIPWDDTPIQWEDEPEPKPNRN